MTKAFGFKPTSRTMRALRAGLDHESEILSDREVRSQIYGVLASKLRMACIVDGDDVDVDRYHTMQIEIAKQLEKKFCTVSRPHRGEVAK